MPTTAARPRPGAHRAVPPAVAARPQRQGPERPRRLSMALACYVGLAVIVGLTVLISRVVPTPVAAPLFVVACGALVAVFHPRITLRRRS